MSQAARKTTNDSGVKTLKGRVERYLSGPSADGFAILTLTTGKGPRVTVKGRNVLTGFRIGEKIEVRGKLVKHPRYGDQVEAVDARPIDDGIEGLSRWLAEAGFEGIGPVRAQQIAATLGDQAIMKIVEGTSEAREMLGKRFDEVSKALASRHAEATYGSKLAALDIGRGMRVKIYEKFGANTGKIIESDPYRLIHEVEGIAFRSADEIARNAGMPADSPSRILAAAYDVLREAANDGHSWMPVDEIVAGAARRTKLKAASIAKVIADAECPGAQPMIGKIKGKEVAGWALEFLAFKETALAQAIVRKLAEPKRMNAEDAAKLIDTCARTLDFPLEPEQREAAIMALVEPLCVITGNPGTGKTTVLEVITKAWKARKKQIKLASPTGKAAQRMNEKTGIPAETLHRLLESNSKQFKRNRKNPIEADAIAIDEGSMLDISLGYAFSQAWDAAQILLVGDADQLPSVDAGRVFGDLVEALGVPTVRLTQIRRQGKGSAIAEGADRIRRGLEPNWYADLSFIEVDDNQEIAETACRLFHQETRKGRDVQVLSPGHAAECGTMAINKELSIKDEGLAVRLSGGAEARVGDKVIQMDNNEKLEVFNGDCGTIIAIRQAGKNLIATVKIDGPDGGREIDYMGSLLGELALSWSLTVHKTQGSEYDVVILNLSTSHWRLLRRTMLNTGITRAKGKCYVVGQRRALMQAIRTDDGNERMTQLKTLLNTMID